MSGLAQQRDQLQADIASAVAQASQGVAEERNRLAALMSELSQSVVVCNLDGRVLLYNQRARQQMQALSDGPQPAGATLINGGNLHAYGPYAAYQRLMVFATGRSFKRDVDTDCPP